MGTKVSEAEFALLEERARGAGLTLGEWVRDVLLAAPVESGPDASEVALAEVLALRSLLLNLHFRAAKGEPVAEADMRGLIERADGVKMQRARERLEAVRAADRAAAEPVSVKEFNRLNRSDGIGFVQQERTLKQRLFGKVQSLNLPRRIESSHILIMGDSGSKRLV